MTLWWEGKPCPNPFRLRENMFAESHAFATMSTRWFLTVLFFKMFWSDARKKKACFGLSRHHGAATLGRNASSLSRRSLKTQRQFGRTESNAVGTLHFKQNVSRLNGQGEVTSPPVGKHDVAARHAKTQQDIVVPRCSKQWYLLWTARKCTYTFRFTFRSWFQNMCMTGTCLDIHRWLSLLCDHKAWAK